ncbi:hypothetical protein JCGZ_26684 [Jatropha curcas]|uniref:Uncharacterized protein n=1 Tax=Jatropha curcas TaxID=180498 RepID=A0A067L3W0_JATCU|nr:hypothetical protein JCGZ_26684 [Jatropha curcas]
MVEQQARWWRDKVETVLLPCTARSGRGRSYWQWHVRRSSEATLECDGGGATGCARVGGGSPLLERLGHDADADPKKKKGRKEKKREEKKGKKKERGSEGGVVVGGGVTGSQEAQEQGRGSEVCARNRGKRKF